MCNGKVPGDRHIITQVPYTADAIKHHIIKSGGIALDGLGAGGGKVKNPGSCDRPRRVETAANCNVVGRASKCTGKYLQVMVYQEIIL